VLTETQVIKQLVREYRGKPLRSQIVVARGVTKLKPAGRRRGTSPALGSIAAYRMQDADPLQPAYHGKQKSRWSGWTWGCSGPSLRRRMHKRIAKKLAQPLRRKRRGPLRAKAAGTNEVRARRR
jgi:hypothetical protein